MTTLTTSSPAPQATAESRTGATAAPAEPTAITAATSGFWFYDIESLSNAFTLCGLAAVPGYTPRLDVFTQIDDADLRARVVPADLARAIRRGNPGLPSRTRIAVHDLGDPDQVAYLAGILGVSDADPVCDPDASSSYPAGLRPRCDTDPDYDPRRNPFLAGYNSANYDLTMLAQYLSEAFNQFWDIPMRIRSARRELAVARIVADKTLPGTPEADEAAAKVCDLQARIADLSTRTPAVVCPSAAAMRVHNDALFTSDNKEYMPGYLGWNSQAALIRGAMIASGRHLDVARLNEAQRKVGLKRLLGMLGHQVRESDKLGHDSVITTLDELYELLTYNTADVVGLGQLFRHPVYSGAFDLKAGLLNQYTETRRTTSGRLRTNHTRLTVDSSSAQFVARILCPDGHLDDIEKVSFDYPAPEVADRRHIPVVNVLDEAVAFFETEVVPHRDTDPAEQRAHEQFMEVVRYYRRIENTNFNESEDYQKTWGGSDPDDPQRSTPPLKAIPQAPNNIPYFLPGGKPSSCFATFSSGGIHGAELDTATHQCDLLVHQITTTLSRRARDRFPDPADLLEAAKDEHNRLVLPDGSAVDKRLVLLGSDPATVRYRRPRKDDPGQAEELERARRVFPDPADLLARQRPDSQRFQVHLDDGTVVDAKALLTTTTASRAAYRPDPDEPVVFAPARNGSTKLRPRYTHTSAALVTHEDFTSYYPNLLRNMRAFWNERLGEDRYAAIFEAKQAYGRQMKDPAITPAERARLQVLRNGTKLILNSASGAGDTTFGHSPIRMNNRIISMRIMGQIMSWRIGQAQTLAGARIISTNTDGLYAAGDPRTNVRVLREQSGRVGVEIEPETLFLVSKDSNNRIEMSVPADQDRTAPHRWEITGASGGTLACYREPTPAKALAHPAVIDAALVRYLRQITVSQGEAGLARAFDPVLGRRILTDILEHSEPLHAAILFQNIVAASVSSISYPFAVTATADPVDADGHRSATITGYRPLQEINRIFYATADVPDSVHLRLAGSWKVSPASRQARLRDPERRPVDKDPIALDILAHHGWFFPGTRHTGRGQELPDDQDVVVRRINGIDPQWPVLIRNEDLHALSADDLDDLLGHLDLEIYLGLLDDTFTRNWRNTPPQER